MKNKFNNWTLLEFNNMIESDIKKTDTFFEIDDKIMNSEINYFYLSMDKKDVLEAIENEKEIAKALNLNLLFIKDISLYIATY